MKMLQEYWASTVIFIAIFSQCGKTVPWKKIPGKTVPVWKVPEKMVPGKVLSDSSEKLGFISFFKFESDKNCHLHVNGRRIKRLFPFSPSPFFCVKYLAERSEIKGRSPRMINTRIDLKSMSSLSNQRIPIKLVQRCSGDHFSADLLSGDFLSRHFLSRGLFPETVFRGPYFRGFFSGIRVGTMASEADLHDYILPVRRTGSSLHRRDEKKK